MTGLKAGTEYTVTVQASNKESGAKGLPSTGEFKTAGLGENNNTAL